jgi:zinc transport system ATP-binding protein
VLSGCLNKLRWRPFYTKKEKALAERNLKLLDIEKIRNKSFKELSGGQMQRVLIARAICATNKLIILDEPFVGLDQYMVRQLEQTIKKINKELGVTIVMVTHNFHATLKDTNKVIELSNKGCTSYTTQEYMNINEVK